MQASGVQAMTRDARVDFRDMHHGGLKIALARIAAIAAKAHIIGTRPPRYDLSLCYIYCIDINSQYLSLVK
jgi:hypothetical protein